MFALWHLLASELVIIIGCLSAIIYVISASCDIYIVGVNVCVRLHEAIWGGSAHLGFADFVVSDVLLRSVVVAFGAAITVGLLAGAVVFFYFAALHVAVP